MKPERLMRGQNRKENVFYKKDHTTVPLEACSQEKFENPGLSQKFLHRIAKAVEESNMGRSSCPT
jgi:hypothetical protein